MNKFFFISSACDDNKDSSPRKIAKNVIEKLSKCRSPQKTSQKDSLRAPITIDDIDVGSLNKPTSTRQTLSSLNGDSKNTITYDVDGLSSFRMNKLYPTDAEGYPGSMINDDDDTEDELQTSLKEANNRVMFLSDEFEQQRFLYGGDFDVPLLIRILKSIAEEKLSLAYEVSSIMQSRIADCAKAKEELRCLKIELCDHARRLEREKNDIQVSLEKELDRRSSDLSRKLEKYQSEEQRLREHVSELTEQNVGMQTEISALKEKESEKESIVTHSEQLMKDQTMMLDELKKQNQDLSDCLVQLKGEYKASAGDPHCFQRNYQEKEDECKDMHKSVTRLMRTTCEQENTISELRESLNVKLERKSFPERG